MTTGRPGVYVSERLLPAPITTTATANAAGACIGEFAQGPSTVTLVRSWYDFTKTFGGYNANYPATVGVGEFFKNGGTELYVRRVLGADAGQATADILDATSAAVATVTAIEYGMDGTNLRVTPTLSRTVDTTKWYTLTVSRENGSSSSSLADDIVLEQYLNVRFDDATSSDYVLSVVNPASKYIQISDVDTSKTPVSGTVVPLTGASLDGDPAVIADYTDVLSDFETIERPLVMFAPEVLQDGALGAADGADVQIAIASWCESHDGFAVIDTPAGQSVADALAFSSGVGSLSHAAVYYPNVYIADPLGRSASSIRLVGPAGSVAGLYIATDSARGPFKAPAGINAGIGTAIATEKKFTSTELDDLNSSQHPVNAIRQLPGAGVVVMGGRTLLQDGTANRYVSMRRSLIYIKKELEQITQFALFENNDERLWGRIRTSVGVFLNDYRNRGGLRGQLPSDAFYVKCDGENNSAESIANGEVNIEVGVALEYPAEFVLITLSQKTVS